MDNAGSWPDPTFVTEAVPDGTFAVPRGAPSRRPASDGVDKVLVLWDGAVPDEDELKELVRRLVPGFGAHGADLALSESSGISRALAAWYVLDDERRGKLPPGASSRMRQLLDGSPRGKRLVTVVDAPDGRPRATPRAAVRELVLRHAARVELEARPEYPALPNWVRMLGPEPLDFITGDGPCPLRFGPFPSRMREFGDLTVVVSVAGTCDPDRIRAQLPGGYYGAFDALVRAAGIRLGESTVAHWIRCDDNGKTAAHLSFLPPRGLPMLMAVELLSAAERGRKLS